MFKVQRKDGAGLIQVVYATHKVDGTTIFLIFKNGNWKWVNSEDYEPFLD